MIIKDSEKTWNTLAKCTRALALVAVLAPAAALAQFDQAISDASLTDPWDLEKAVVLSLPVTSPALDEPHVRSQLHATLRKLEEELAGFESQVLTFIERLIGDPQYPYVAAENSAEMSAQIASIEKNFDSLYTTLAVEQRADARAAKPHSTHSGAPWRRRRPSNATSAVPWAPARGKKSFPSGRAGGWLRNTRLR